MNFRSGVDSHTEDMRLIDNMINSTFVMMIIENNFINHLNTHTHINIIIHHGAGIV